jgi:hypothetical protein
MNYMLYVHITLDEMVERAVPGGACSPLWTVEPAVPCGLWNL